MHHGVLGVMPGVGHSPLCVAVSRTVMAAGCAGHPLCWERGGGSRV